MNCNRNSLRGNRTLQSSPAGRYIQTRLRTGASTLSDDEKARLSREGDQSLPVQRKQQDSQDDFNEAQREIVDRIGRKMIDVLDKYSKVEGYGVIFDTSAQNTPVV